MSIRGQTIEDRINAVRFTLFGQTLARCIYKATTEELIKPKKKHLDHLVACTYDINCSMLELANLLIERTNHTNWAVVYKALIVVHHLMSHGSERFTQHLASSNYSFQLGSFLDRIVAKGYAMSPFIRRYSNYINRKALSYRTLAVDPCRVVRQEDNVLKTMPVETLLSALAMVQAQLDALFDFDASVRELNNSIITCSFVLLYNDATRLFVAQNQGLMNLIQKYHSLDKKLCREALEACKKFPTCTDKFKEFLEVAESINLNQNKSSDIAKIPSSFFDGLEAHLSKLENGKKRDKNIVIEPQRQTFTETDSNILIEL